MASVNLRAWRTDDAPAIVPILADPQVSRWSQIADLGTERWIEAQRAEPGLLSRAVSEAGDDHVVGKVALRIPSVEEVENSTVAAIGPDDSPLGVLSYWVLPAARRRGIAFAAASAMIDLARESAQVRSVVLFIEPDNRPSIRVAERLGAMRRELRHFESDREGRRGALDVFVLAMV